MKLSVLCWFLLFVVIFFSYHVECKRGGGRSRGSSSGWFSMSKKKSGSSSKSSSRAKPTVAAPVKESHKPSAPAEPTVKKESSHFQQAGNPTNQNPVGWNVPGTHGGNPTGNVQGSGWKSGYQTNSQPNSAHHVPNSGSHGAPGYPGYGGGNQAPGYPNYNGGHQAPGYPSYGGGHQAPGYPSYGGGHQAPGYPNYGGGYHGPGYSGYGGHGQGFGGGYHGGYNPGYGGFGGGHGGGFGSGGFGGGYGGFGGNSPMGGFGGYGAPYKKSSGFFSGSTITNVVAGMALYHMISSFTRRPYTVYNYHTQPEGAKPPEEIKLPANMLTLCDEKINSMCGAGTHSICTTNGTILCVASMAQAVPCEQDKNSALCVNTTVPSTDKQEPVNVPCFTNLTMDVNLMNSPGGVPKPENTNYTYCVTTMAVAGPEYKPCPEGQITTTNDFRSILMRKYDWFLENEGLRRHFIIHNYDNPIQANGEINMPIHVLTKCTENARKACAPGSVTSCTTFNEVMCVMPTSATVKCDDEKYENTTCIKTTIPCLNKEDPLCKNITETSEEVTIDMPCFANITINSPFANFNLSDFNGTLPELATSSYTYHYQYCVLTLAIPGPETEVCDTTKKQ